MKHLPKIPALFLVILLALSSLSKARAMPVNSPAQHNGENTASIHPASNPILFAVHHQEKTGANLLDRLPRSNSSGHSQNYAFGYRLVEPSLQRQNAICLGFYKAADRSLAAKKLIFPFHSHW